MKTGMLRGIYVLSAFALMAAVTVALQEPSMKVIGGSAGQCATGPCPERAHAVPQPILRSSDNLLLMIFGLSQPHRLER